MLKQANRWKAATGLAAAAAVSAHGDRTVARRTQCEYSVAMLGSLGAERLASEHVTVMVRLGDTT